MISRRNVLKFGVAGACVAVTGAAALVFLNQNEDEPLKTSPGLLSTAPRGDTLAPTTRPSADQPTTVAQVSDEGFDIDLGAVRVSAPAGVAAPGTKVQVTRGLQPPTVDLTALSIVAGDAVEVTLGDGIQPERPVTITFSLAGSQLAAEASEESPLAVLSYSETEDMFFLMEAAWDTEAEVLTVESDHLTPFWQIRMDLPDMFEDLIADLVLNYHYSKPDCAYAPLKAGDKTYSIATIADDSVWPCLQQEDGQIVMELHSNSILPWAVKTLPSTSAEVTGSFGDLNSRLASVYSGFYGLMGDERSAVLPGHVASFRFDPDQPPRMAELKFDAGLFLGTILVWAIQSSLDILLKGKVADELIDGAGALECILEVIDTTQEVTDEQHYIGIINSALVCIRESIIEEGGNWVMKAVAKTAIAIVTLFASGAGLIAASMLGVVRTITATDRISFEISETATAEITPGERLPSGNIVEGADFPDEVPHPTAAGELPATERVAPEANTTLEIESSDGYRATLTVSVGPEIGGRGEAPANCAISFFDISESDIYFRSRVLEFQLESVTVDGFEWPSTRPVKVHYKGYVPCGPTPDATAGFWTLDVYAGSPQSLVVVSSRGMSPAYPDGNFDGPSQLVLVIEDATQESCASVSRSSGLGAEFGNNFGDISSWDRVGGCQLWSIDNTTYEITYDAGGGFTPATTDGAATDGFTPAATLPPPTPFP